MVDLQQGTIEVRRNLAEDWRVSLTDTGDDTVTGGQVKRAIPYLGDEDTELCLTYGDGVVDVASAKAIEFHRAHGCRATITAVRP